MKKKISLSLIVISLCAILSLTACSSKDETSDSEDVLSANNSICITSVE